MPEYKCELCGKVYQSSVRKKDKVVCRSCSQSLRFGGSGNPNWKGGHEHWQEGKLGRDKDGLSWKLQRRLVWERDKYTCTLCQKKKDGWRPDVHHVSPYRISFSHALENLISRCRSCHKKDEAKCKDLWNGKTLGGHIGREPKVTCQDCHNSRRKIVGEGRCELCRIRNVLVPKAKELRDQGKNYREIALSFGVDHKTVWDWLNKFDGH